MKRIIAYTILLMASAGAAHASSISVRELKSRFPSDGSVVVTEHLVVEGVVVSDWTSQNMELNPNVAFDKVDRSVNDATAYIQDQDGNAGIRVVFAEAGENRLERYSKVSIDLIGCVVTREPDPSRVTVSGLGYKGVLSCTPGKASEISLKEKYISDLEDDDVYTYVSLREVEMVFKDGTLADIYEPYAQNQPLISGNAFAQSERMDGWASLARDSRGGHIYLLVNTLCPWRREGKPLPVGAGPLKGIIVHTPMRRYGGDMGRFSIRPVDGADVELSTKRNSRWKTLTGWVLDGENGQKLEFETMGEVESLWKNGVKDDRILSDTGIKSFLWTDSRSMIHVDNDLNALEGDGKGFVHNGAIMFKGPTTGWYDFDAQGNAVSCKSFFIEFSAKKIKVGPMSLNFSWSAGDQVIDHDWGFPSEWTVMCSCDGDNWVRLKETATGNTVIRLRPQPYWDKKSEIANNGVVYKTGYDCGLGNQHRSFALPDSAAGASQVLIRITPAKSAMNYIRKEPATSVDNGTRIKSSFEGKTYIRFGEIRIDYMQ